MTRVTSGPNLRNDWFRRLGAKASQSLKTEKAPLSGPFHFRCVRRIVSLLTGDVMGNL